jgi:hypothetical protein
MSLPATLRTVTQLLAIAFLVNPANSKAQQTPDASMKNGIIVITAFEGDVKISDTVTNQTQ